MSGGSRVWICRSVVHKRGVHRSYWAATTDVEVGMSVDQLAAIVVGKQTEITSMVRGTEGSGGRVLDFSAQETQENKQLCRLHLSLLDRMGVTEEKFGDAESRLAGLE